MRLRNIRTSLIALSIGALGALTASADTTYSVALGNASSQATITATALDFTGTNTVTGASSPFALFPDVTVGESATIGSLSNATYPPGVFVPHPTTAFVSFGTTGDVKIYVNEVFQGAGTAAGCVSAPAPGETCTPIIGGVKSALTLIDLPGNQSTAILNLIGFATDSISGKKYSVSGEFSANFNVPYQTLLAEFARTGSITSSYSSSFDFTAVTVPEPGTTGAVLGGLLVLGSALTRRMKRQ